MDGLRTEHGFQICRLSELVNARDAAPLDSRRLIAVENKDAEVPNVLRGQRRAGLTTLPNPKIRKNFPHADQHSPSRYRLKREKDDFSSKIGLPANS
jgi:hypothetical protein